MWLPRDERHILLAYYVNIFDFDDRDVARHLKNPKWFHSSDWTYVLKLPQWVPVVSLSLLRKRARQIKAYGDRDGSPSKEDILSKRGQKIVEQTIQSLKRLEIANAHLTDRKLIEITPHKSESEVAGVLLTLEGHDLGRKYNSWFYRSGLWFREHKDHWVWLVVSFLGGVLGALLVQWLSD
jgi:hypothetical protein